MDATKKDRILATVSRFCPFCILRRKWPDSAYGRFMSKTEKGCPFCRAYERLEAKGQK